MKLLSIELENVLSFGSATRSSFERGTNLIIGPNGGGKSNLMDIIHGVLGAYVFWHFQSQNWDPSGRGYVIQHQDPARILKKHWDREAHDQRVVLEIELEDGDRQALEAFLDSFDDLCAFEEEQSAGRINEVRSIFQSLKAHRDEALALESIKFTLAGPKIERVLADQWYNAQDHATKLFFRFFNFLEKLRRLAEDMGESESERFQGLKYRSKYYPPSRFHETGDGRIVLPQQNLQDLLLRTKRTSSHTSSSDVAFASFYFARLYARRAFASQQLVEAGRNIDARKFQDEDQVMEVNRYLEQLGDYCFAVGPLNPEAGEYYFKIHVDGREVPLADLSSGQKEAINLILSIVAFDLEDALVMIDEPEAHLHPQWQQKVLKMLRAVSEQRNIQLLLPTHSSLFVDRHSIGEVVRVFHKQGQSQIIPSERGIEWRKSLASDADLIHIIDFSRSVSIFFSDFVLLVEGTSDAIVARQILDGVGLSQESLAIVAAGGKDEFPKYVKFLQRFGIACAIMTDLDSIWRGRLLARVPLVPKIRGELDAAIKHQDVEELRNVIAGRRVDRLTRREVALALLECHRDLASGEAGAVENRLEAISDYLGLRSDIAGLVDLDDLAVRHGHSNFDGLLNSIEATFRLDGQRVPLLILRRGALEMYTGTRHSISGAIAAVASLKTVGWDELPKNSLLVEIRENLSRLISDLLDRSSDGIESNDKHKAGFTDDEPATGHPVVDVKE